MNSTYFFFLHPDAVDVIDHRYNCLPDASPLPVQRRFFLDAVEIRARHITSPWRRTPEGEPFLFQTVYPEVYAAWKSKLCA